MKKTITSLSLAVTGAITAAIAASSPVLAQVRSGVNAATSGTELQGRSIPGSVSSIVNIILWAAGIIAVIMVIWSGMKFITANGEAQKVSAARNSLSYSLIGLVVVVLAYAIVNFVITNI